jgi:hypothetical protein
LFLLDNKSFSASSSSSPRVSSLLISLSKDRRAKKFKKANERPTDKQVHINLLCELQFASRETTYFNVLYAPVVTFHCHFSRSRFLICKKQRREKGNVQRDTQSVSHTFEGEKERRKKDDLDTSLPHTRSHRRAFHSISLSVRLSVDRLFLWQR